MLSFTNIPTWGQDAVRSEHQGWLRANGSGRIPIQDLLPIQDLQDVSSLEPLTWTSSHADYPSGWDNSVLEPILEQLLVLFVKLLLQREESLFAHRAGVSVCCLYTTC